MIDAGDLRAAVAAGTITERQAAALASLAGNRRADRAATPPGDEPFELFRGLNELFIVVGLVILAGGWFGVWALALDGFGHFRTGWIAGALASLALLALLSEYFVRRRRMVAPAILLTIGWGAAALGLWAVALDAVSVFGGVAWDRAFGPLALTTATILAFWLRYRVPFAMLGLAASAFAALVVALAASTDQAVTSQSLFRLSASGPFAWGTLLFGLALFAVAMRFDISDRHRISLRSANGFWLHVAAAPAIVNTLALTLLDRGSADVNLLLAALLLLIAGVAVLIDRRSFLLAATGYVVVLITTSMEELSGFAPAILALGAALVALGAGWQAVRRRMLAAVPDRLRDVLPPGA
jgi:hypothetical protein